MANRGFTVWLTGLPCSGKSTIARRLAGELLDRGVLVEILDGDIVREHLSKGLGFTRQDRDTNIRRIGFVAGLLTRNGVCCIVAAVSPYRSARNEVRETIGDFMEVYVDCPLTVCEARDVKGMYKLARAGRIASFTGVDDPYEPPADADLILNTSSEHVGASVERVLAALASNGYLPRSSRASQPEILERSEQLRL